MVVGFGVVPTGRRGGAATSTRVWAKKKRIKKDTGPSAEELAEAAAAKKEELVDPKKVRKMGALKKVKRRKEAVKDEKDLPPIKEEFLGVEPGERVPKKKVVRVGWKAVKVTDPEGAGQAVQAHRRVRVDDCEGV